MKYDHEYHTKLITELSGAHANASEFLAKELKPGSNPEPTDFNAMKAAFAQEEQARKKLWDYLNHFIGPDGRIHID